jgi:hypothetical protein
MGLFFIAIGAILAFATHFTVSGLDIRMVGWILMLVGLAAMAITFMFVRPRRNRLMVAEQIGDEPAYDVRPDGRYEPFINPTREEIVEEVEPVQPQGRTRRRVLRGYRDPEL